MCLILFSWDNHPKYKLILAANRDEFYERPTSTLNQWEETPSILAGKDLTGGGTWMGVNQDNKWTAITNHRNPKRVLQNAPSRGDLTMDFLVGRDDEKSYYTNKKSSLEAYNGFNLLVGSFQKLAYFNNVDKEYQELESGIYGLSNAVLDTPWPKLSKAKERFSEIIGKPTFQKEEFLTVLQDKELADDEALPQTGVSYEWEKAVSAICIDTPKYGTCCSTIITLTHEGQGEITEVSYPVGSRKKEHKTLSFDWSGNI